MPLCCVEISIGARVVAVIGLLAAAIVIMELSTELARGRGDGGVAVLLGLNLDELDSRQRHTPHTRHHDEPMTWESWGRQGDDADEKPLLTHFEHNVLTGFLVYAIMYAASSSLLAYASIVMLKWGALPWLFLQVLSIASQAARLVFQVAQYEHSLSEPAHHSVLNAQPMVPHAVPRGLTWEQHLEQDHGPRAGGAAGVAGAASQPRAGPLVHVALTSFHLVLSVYMWLVVLVAHREWVAVKKPRRRAPAPGDEGYSLSLHNLNNGKQALASTPLKTA